MSVSLITPNNGYNAFYKCNFYTGTAGILDYNLNTVYADGSIPVGPPNEIYGVACQPTPGGSSTCLPEYGKQEPSIIIIFHLHQS